MRGFERRTYSLSRSLRSLVVYQREIDMPARLIACAPRNIEPLMHSACRVGSLESWLARAYFRDLPCVPLVTPRLTAWICTRNVDV
jgi:hypothetical protein